VRDPIAGTWPSPGPVAAVDPGRTPRDREEARRPGHLRHDGPGDPRRRWRDRDTSASSARATRAWWPSSRDGAAASRWGAGSPGTWGPTGRPRPAGPSTSRCV